MFDEPGATDLAVAGLINDRTWYLQSKVRDRRNNRAVQSNKIRIPYMLFPGIYRVVQSELN